MTDNGVVLLLPSVVKPNRQLHEEHLEVNLVHDEVWLEAMGQWEVPLELFELVDFLVEEPHEEVIAWHR